MPLRIRISSGVPTLRQTWRYLPASASPAIWHAMTSGNEAAKGRRNSPTPAPEKRKRNAA